MLYVDALDVHDLDLNFPQGDFAINVWSRENVEKVLQADLQKDKKSYGKLQVCLFFFAICEIVYFITLFLLDATKIYFIVFLLPAET